MHAVARSVLLLLAVPGAAAAHHSFFGRFDTQKLVELEGEVTDVLWRNPHAYFSVRADGVVWEIETSSLTVLKRMGIEDGTIRVGQAIRIAANPPIGAKKEMYARHVLLPDGRELLMNVGLTPRWTERANAVGDDSLLMARQGDGSRPDLGLFRVWSHTRTIARLFPEVTDPTVDIGVYPLTPAARAQLEEYDLARHIYMNPNAARELTQPTPLGDSVGRWDGAALVVTTTRISWPFFSQLGIRQSPAVEIVERFTPSADGSRLDYEMTVTDPATFTRPVVLSQHWLWLPSVTLLPYECTVH